MLLNPHFLHTLVYAYFCVNLEIVWQTVPKDLPPLIVTLEEALGGEP